ncbi:MAG: Rab family GTPase [Anaerolineae bacterium]
MVSLSKKVCLLGDFAVGKTSLVRRLVHDMFDDRYISTIGVKVSRKTITIARDQDIIDLSIILWDLAGSEEFNHMRASYLRGASGLFLVADVTRPATLANLPAYLADLDQSVGRIPIVLAANKADLMSNSDDSPLLAAVQAQAAAPEAPWFMTSALTGSDVENAFRQLGRMMVLDAP